MQFVVLRRVTINGRACEPGDVVDGEALNYPPALVAARLLRPADPGDLASLQPGEASPPPPGPEPEQAEEVLESDPGIPEAELAGNGKEKEPIPSPETPNTRPASSRGGRR